MRRDKIKIPKRTAKFREEYDRGEAATKRIERSNNADHIKNTETGRRVRSMTRINRINVDEYVLNNLRKLDHSRQPSLSYIPDSTFEKTSINYVQPEYHQRLGQTSTSENKIKVNHSKKSSCANIGSSTNYQTRPNTGVTLVEQQAFTVKRRAQRPASFYLSNYSSQKQSQIFELMR
jgi:hypothetical protein